MNGVRVEIVGISDGGQGQSCNAHEVCGAQIKVDSILIIQSLIIINDEKKAEAALGVYTFENGLPGCLVGFLHWYAIKHTNDFAGQIVRVVELFASLANLQTRACSYAMKGSCMALIEG